MKKEKDDVSMKALVSGVGRKQETNAAKPEGND